MIDNANGYAKIEATEQSERPVAHHDIVWG